MAEYVRGEAYHPVFHEYGSPDRTKSYRFYYDGWGHDYLLRHIELVNATSYSGLAKLLRRSDFDVLHCNSVTEHLSAGLRRWGPLPVITEVYDLTSLYELRNLKVLFAREHRKVTGPRKWVLDHVIRNALRWDKEVHERGAGLVYTSENMLKHAKALYDITCPSVVVPNAVYGKLLPHESKCEKLSAIEGGIHLVYTGIIRSSTEGHHRDICPQLDRLSRGEVVTHLYPIVPESERDRVHAALDGNKNIRWHAPATYEQLYGELRQYDAGLVLLAPYDTALLDLALPNKIFEYAAAGIPSLVSPYPPLLDFVKKYSCGQPLPEPDRIASDFHPSQVSFHPEFTMEYYIPSLVRLYERVLESARQ